MQLPTGDYGGRGRVKGSAWQSPAQIEAAQEKKEEEDNAKASPFEEFKSADGKVTVFRQTPYAENTHTKAYAYIELYKGKVEKTVIYFFKKATCEEFCDLVRRQILNGVFRSHDLELFLADDDGNFDDKNEPPPSHETLAKIVNIGLDSFYFKITNSWQLQATEKANLVKKIIGHKSALPVFDGPLSNADGGADYESSDDSDDDVQDGDAAAKPLSNTAEEVDKQDTDASDINDAPVIDAQSSTCCIVQ